MNCLRLAITMNFEVPTLCLLYINKNYENRVSNCFNFFFESKVYMHRLAIKH